MFQFKKIAKLPLILIQYELEREFLQEEMYCCPSCQKICADSVHQMNILLLLQKLWRCLNYK
ncbi:unnamed protein product [Paramecium octaurelia]|uniref:Uncharacterized protein n=1 Tax=Paramecium octaurelia TaxID=43137 RepID=A0A8S1RWJ6_PAROT|nr:unnamed protein product [Paramecium octaurelia]